MSKYFTDKEYILFTSSNFPKGGAGAAYLNLFCKGLALNNRSIRVYLTKGYAFRNNTESRIGRNNITQDGIAYSYLGLAQRPEKKSGKTLDDFLSFMNLLLVLPSLIWKRRRSTIVIYLIDLIPGIFIYLTTFLFKCRVITIVPEYFNKANFPGFMGKIKWFNFKFTFDHLNPLSNGLIVFSSFLKKKYLEKGFKEKRIFVQPNLTDFDFWTAVETNEVYTVGYSGTPGEKDGVVFLFKALSVLKEETEINLLVIGDTPFGRSMIPWLEKMCEDLGVRERVSFTGLVEYENVKYHLSKCRIAAITRPDNIQTRAGFPTKLGEYMALKKPVLATDFGEVKAYFEDGKEIIIAENTDPECIAAKIKWMLQNTDSVDIIAGNGYNRAFNLLEYKSSMTRVISFMNSRLS
jgi:glycosyltransferase involved in cell wall biosynthesis